MDEEIVKSELTYKAIRSSGSGGQHVNKVSSKVVVFFCISDSNGLSLFEKEVLLEKLTSKLSKEGVLQLGSEESRSQFKNKALVTERIMEMLKENLVIPVQRKPTKPSLATKARILKNKAIQSEKKKLRKPPKE